MTFKSQLYNEYIEHENVINQVESDKIVVAGDAN